MIIVIPWTFFCSLHAQGEDRTLDSLRQLLTSPVDTVRIDAMTALGRRLRPSRPDSAVYWLEEARTAARQAEDWNRYGQATASLGVAYGMQGDNSHALEFLKEKLELDRQRGEPGPLAGSYSNLGIVYKNIGDYSASLDYYRQALALYDQAGDRSGAAACYSNLGIVYHLLKDLPKSREYYEKSLALRREIGEPLTSLYNNLGLLLEEEGRYAEALEYMRLFLEDSRQENNLRQVADGLSNTGHIYWSLKAYERAVPHLEEALELYRDLGVPVGISKALYNLSRVKLELGKVAEALALAENHLRVVEEMNNLSLWVDARKLLAAVYEKQGDYRGALEQQQEYARLRDSLYRMEKNNELQKWQVRLDVYEKDRQIGAQDLDLKLLNARIELDRRRRHLLGLALLTLAVAALFFYQRNRLREKANRALRQKNDQIEGQKAEIERINQELEKRMLRAQINPHFIFNSLSSIQHFITAGDKMSALKYLSKFSSLLRQTLENSVSLNVPLAEEIRLLKTYIDLEALRFDHGFTYSIETDGEIDPYDTEVPVLLVQPFIENAILHGLMPRQGGRELSVSFAGAGDYIRCTIRDNGIGRAAAGALEARKPQRRPSRGIAITRKRLELLRPGAGCENLLTIRDLCDPGGRPAGTEVTIHIPKPFK